MVILKLAGKEHWELNDFAHSATVGIKFQQHGAKACPALLNHPLFAVPLLREWDKGKGDKW